MGLHQVRRVLRLQLLLQLRSLTRLLQGHRMASVVGTCLSQAMQLRENRAFESCSLHLAE